MTVWIESLLALLVLSDLVALGSSRVWAIIRIVAFQGLLLGIYTFVLHLGDLTWHVLLMAVGSVVVKCFVFPALLFRAVRETDIRRDIEPYLGYHSSLVLGTGLIPVSIWLGARLSGATPSPLVMPVALYTILTGLLLIITRRKALSQVLGYLVLENGIYAFGVGLVRDTPFIVELGVLLDLLVAVFVMGITLFNINRGFDHIDTARLAELRE